MLIRDLQAGPDLDRAVAEATGWCCLARGPIVGVWEGHPPGADCDPAFYHDVGRAWIVFPFSRDAGLAWSAAERALVWPRFYLRVTRTAQGRWRVDVELSGGDGPVISHCAPTIAHALSIVICEALGVYEVDYPPETREDPEHGR